MKIHDLPLHKRPREKLLEKGQLALSDAELLAILLRTGYQGKSALELAERILSNQNLAKLLSTPLEKLLLIKGLGYSRASILNAVGEIAQRVTAPTQSATVNKPEDIAKMVQYLVDKKQEHLIGLYLDARNQLIAQETICVGTINGNLIHPREVFAPALQHRAATVIIAHNHPSGNPLPSEDDIITTEKLVEASMILDLPLIDHVIVGKQGWLSLKQEGLL